MAYRDSGGSGHLPSGARLRDHRRLVGRLRAIGEALPGRARAVPLPGPRSWAAGLLLLLFAALDNLLKGAALNTVQIAEELVARDLVHPAADAIAA